MLLEGGSGNAVGLDGVQVATDVVSGCTNECLADWAPSRQGRRHHHRSAPREEMRRKLARSAGLSIHTTTWRCSLERTKTKL